MGSGTLQRALTRLACLLAVVSLCGAAQAQSGRRIPERKWAGKPPGAEAPPPPAVPEPEPDRPAPRFLVTAMKEGLSVVVPSDVAGAVFSACVSTLGAIPGFAARGAKDGSRKDAVEVAKGETTAYTLFIALDVDTMAEASEASSGYALVASYYLYAPGTAKVRTQGRVYINYRYGLGRPRGVPSVLYPRAGGMSYYPQEAGEEIAKRVASAIQSSTASGSEWLDRER